MDKQKIGAIVPVYNREKWIGPYLEMLEDIDKVVVLSDKPWSIGWGGNEEVSAPDKTEKILTEYFPDVPVIKDSFLNHRASLEAGIKAMPDYDRLIIWDCDCFFTKKDFKWFIKFINQDAHVFAINFETMIQEYYFDYRYGKPAIPGGPFPIMAFDPKVWWPYHMTGGGRIDGVVEESHKLVWDTPKVKVHHFRFCKPEGSGAWRCKEPESSEGYEPAPREIINLLKKWETKIKSL